MVKTGADPSRGVQEQVRMLWKVMLCFRLLIWSEGFEGGGEGEAEKPTFHVGGATSKNLVTIHDWKSKECKAGCCRGQKRKVDPLRF